MPEVAAVQTYVGTAQPFNFNGMVRHYYLRDRPWEADLLVMLEDKEERELGSHALAVAARAMLTPLADELGARIAVVEMPPGPPVLQTVVAEVYGPDAATRRQVADDLVGIFEEAEGIVDVDSYMAEPYSYWRFEVDAEKAVRMGISVDAINRNLAMAMGGFRLGDVKRGVVQEPTYIVLQVPLANRAEIGSLASLPIQSEMGGQVPLGELGRFVQQQEDPVIYHKDLRPMEYVVGEMEGRLGAPIYGMLAVEDRLKQYRTPDGVEISGMPRGLIGPPLTDRRSGFEWSGEWTVTYETFRDMGLAFIAALVLIYGLIVWEFRNFKIAGLIMSPIPLTLIGIIPGHLIMGAEFTATSMIGLIALGGIIVRQSILIVEFVKIEVAKGKPVREAAVAGAEVRMRPILITSLTLMAGAWAIIEDPIFQGMAVSLLFGAGVATLMAVIVIPLGCISLCREFYLVETSSGERALSARYCEIEGVPTPDPPAPRAARARPAGGTPLLLRLWSAFVGVVFSVIEGVGRLLAWLQQRRVGRSGKGSASASDAAITPTDTASARAVADSRAEPAPQAAAAKRSSAAARKPARAPRKAATKAVADDATTVKKPRARRATKKTADKPEDPGER
jgi:multidrug efflux pump subunit AcrB